MTIVTHYAAAAFDRAADGTLVVACVHDCRSAGVAMRVARELASLQAISALRRFSRASEMCLTLKSTKPRVDVC